MATLQVQSEAVKKAALECPEAKRILKTLFPAAFAPQVVCPAPNHPGAPSMQTIYVAVDGVIRTIQPRAAGAEVAGVYLSLLNEGQRWAIRKEVSGSLVLTVLSGDQNVD